MIDHVLTCKQCSIECGVDISLIVPDGHFEEKQRVVLAFLSKHHLCGITEQSDPVSIDSDEYKKASRFLLKLMSIHGLKYEQIKKFIKTLDKVQEGNVLCTGRVGEYQTKGLVE